MNKIDTIIFDLGGVLIDWNPEYVFLNLFNGDREKTQWFLDNICTSDWNENQDAGYPLAKATEERIVLFPEWENEIKMFYGQWEDMLGDAISGTVDILKKLIDSKQYKVVALTNWSAETFPIALKKFEFLHWFEGILVSGEEKTRKPFDEIYHLTLNRFNIKAEHAIFIDDNLRNIEAANTLGIHGIHFKSPNQLIEQLKTFNINL
ncbi:HAD family hydrolase [Hwangdonia lutea]|uniref:HAD family phosphatase n=1 Tax=Hwangdonia lutea TaxID=3075823 RepID=A0AA97EM03_9FLAO|nr:HAD family phosphatase [Hwangdonia sp. SCSIO 19198]WOD43431.1 HAD family phosphatase [Hwangdonia sp. SCSIO 19198]